MVHGIALCSRYVLSLKKPINYFETLCSVMKTTKHRMEVIGDNKDKIEVFCGRSLDKRFSNEPKPRKMYKHLEVLFYPNSKRPTTTAEELNELNLWLDAFFYSTVKFDYQANKKLSVFDSEAWKKERQVSVVEEDCGYYGAFLDTRPEHFTEEYYHTMKKVERLHAIMQDPERFKEIQEIEREVSTVELTTVETAVLDKVRSHPLLEGLIADEGFELYSQWY